MRLLRTYLRLTRFERHIVFQSAIGLVIARIGHLLKGFGRWKNAEDVPASAKPSFKSSRAVIDVARSIARIHAGVERHFFFKPTCLERSVVLSSLLWRHGVPATVRIGGRKESERFDAHAWVEVDNVPFDPGNAHLDFVPFDKPITLAGNRIR